MMHHIAAYCRIRTEHLVVNGSVRALPSENTGFVETLYQHSGMNYPKFYKMDPQSQLGVLASEWVLKEAPVSDYRPESIATFFMNKHGSLDTDLRFNASLSLAPSPSLFVYTLPNIVAGEICIRHRIKGENFFLVSDFFDADLMFESVELLFQQSGVEVCLAGWIDVLQDQWDVLLYLIEKRKRGLAMEHSAATLHKLYESELWKS